MKPYFSYFGAKWRLARWYPQPTEATLRGGKVLVEPFAGAAGYATFWSVPRVLLVEQDERVAGVWDYLIRTSAEEILRLPDLPVDGEVSQLPVCQEARWLIGFWLACGRAEPAQRWSGYAKATLLGKPRDAHNPLIWGPRVRQRLAEQVPRIRGWQVRHGSWVDTAYPGDAETWFIDPPYTQQGHTYRKHSVDYAALGAWVQGLPGRVIACEGPGADWLEFQPFRLQLGTNGKNRAPRRQEFWWYRDGQLTAQAVPGRMAG